MTKTEENMFKILTALSSIKGESSSVLIVEKTGLTKSIVGSSLRIKCDFLKKTEINRKRYTYSITKKGRECVKNGIVVITTEAVRKAREKAVKIESGFDENSEHKKMKDMMYKFIVGKPLEVI